MFRTRSALALWLALLAALLARPGVSRGQTRLKMQFEPEQTLRYSMEMTNKMDMGPAGKLDQEMVMEWTLHVEGVEDDGSAQVTQTIRRIKLAMTLPPPVSQEISFDSDTAEEPENPVVKAMAGGLTPMIGGEMKMKISPAGEISDFELDEQLTKHFEKQKGQAGGMGLGPDKMREMVEQMSQPLPQKDIQAGDKWDRTVRTDLPFGKMEAQYEYTYAGPDEEQAALERIDIGGEVALQAAEKSPFKIEMKDQELSGYLLFDNQAGRMAKTVINQKFTMEIEAGQKINIDADSNVLVRLMTEEELQERITPAGDKKQGEKEQDKPPAVKSSSPKKSGGKPVKP